ncbi:unnamed protein product [Orchesella dallaii]|uniref:CWH43-like N-terminal domain-containing protein n=1 Tax=Orchesella dallaii TaxID=48710 RepID=A0ABP1QNE9_9HEXA
MTTSRLHYVPLAVFFIFPITFATTYFTAVKLDHINAFFAYISDTGTFAPEMCIFGLGLSIAMVFVGGVAYIRFMQIEEYLRQKGREENGKMKIWNKVGLFFGLLAALGACVVGAFQETSVLSVHIIGAFMAFGGGSIFLIIQGFFTKAMAPQFGSKSLAYLRIFLGVSCLILFIISYSTGATSLKYFTGDKAVKWEPHHGGWGLRVTSTVTEWVMAALFDLYFLTFVPEFKRITFVAPQFGFVEMTKERNMNGKTTVVMHQAVTSISEM